MTAITKLLHRNVVLILSKGMSVPFLKGMQNSRGHQTHLLSEGAGLKRGSVKATSLTHC